MKEYNGGLGRFLNEVSQTAEKDEDNADKIIYVDIEEIETNPKNFYGLRNIDELSGLIAVSHLIEPLTVSRKADGKYMLISGHRRRAAVQKLLDDGVYTERKLPCIVKVPTKIKIEQENGETIEFDEDAVEMLNLIASNRGQREERTIDEKLQEVKYLEKFAKAIYHQKNYGERGRFVNFFAEEILNISKSQLLRINSLEKLTEKVRQAIDERKIGETAAMEMTSMTAEEQDACLEKILSGKMKGTVQEIQKFKSAKNESTYPKNLVPETETLTKEKSPVRKMVDVPEKFEDPQKEAENWFYQECLASYEEAKRLSEEETNELKAAQWGIRASVARYHIEELKLRNNK